MIAHPPRLLRTGVLTFVVGVMTAGCFLLPDRGPWTVHDVSRIGGYLSAAISRDSETLGFYFAPTADCQAMLQFAGEIEYRKRGPLGTLEQGDRTCAPVGIGRIRSWALRSPTPRNLPILPSQPAHYSEIHRNEDVVLVRGNFPLSGLVYFHSGRDAVAFLPNSEICRRQIEDGGANMQYRRATQEVIWLGGASARCPILGLARPLAP